MDTYRTKPAIGKLSSSGSAPKSIETMGYGQLIAILVLGYAGLFTLSRIGPDWGGGWDIPICLGVLIGFLVLWILGIQSETKARLDRNAQIREWISACEAAKVNIVGRGHTPGGVNDSDDIHHDRPSYYLRLEMSPAQKAVSPDHTVVEVDIDKDVYRKLEKRDTVRIYYKAETPLTFLLADEL